jgi:hypothetical protein
MQKNEVKQIRAELKDLSARRREVIRETTTTLRTAEADDLAKAKEAHRAAAKARRDAARMDAMAAKIEAACAKRRKALTCALERRVAGAERRKQILLGRLAAAEKPKADAPKGKGGRTK